ncbi:hypothetical protein Bbelb_392250 [Branchiostoma belcheri]|nr:hypothetical protein Bbelb_392250 [Branchiostoma belcheri]
MQPPRAAITQTDIFSVIDQNLQVVFLEVETSEWLTSRNKTLGEEAQYSLTDSESLCNTGYSGPLCWRPMVALFTTACAVTYFPAYAGLNTKRHYIATFTTSRHMPAFREIYESALYVCNSPSAAWVPSSIVTTGSVLSLTTMDYPGLEPGQSLGGHRQGRRRGIGGVRYRAADPASGGCSSSCQMDSTLSFFN